MRVVSHTGDCPSTVFHRAPLVPTHVTGNVPSQSLTAQFARKRTLGRCSPPSADKSSKIQASSFKIQDPSMTSNYYYPIDVPPLELPASQTRFPTLQPAGAFLKQMHSPFGSTDAYAQQQQLKSVHVGAAASPTSPSSVAVASSFLASIRHGLEDLVHDDDDDSDDDDSDDDDESPRYYSASSNNTYYSPPSSFSAQATSSSSSPSSLFPMTQQSTFPLQGGVPSRNMPKSDDDLIFDMEM